MSQETLPEFGISKNIKQVGRTDCQAADW